MPSTGRRICQAFVVVAVVAVVSFQATGVASAVPQVGLGTASSFAILAGSPSVSNTGLTVVSGDLGIAPAAAVIGFGGPPNGTVVNGAIHTADALAVSAKSALTTAYLDAAGRVDTAPPLGAALDGLTLAPGVYSGGALGLGAGGTLTLNGGGDPNAVFIFRASSTLITLAGSTVVLIGQAQACNVYWQVTSSATFGTNSTFVGTVMALTDIQAQTGATIAGRLLARNGQVTLDTNRVTRPACAATSGSDPTSSTTSSSTTTTSTSTTSTTIDPSAPTNPTDSGGAPTTGTDATDATGGIGGGGGIGAGGAAGGPASVGEQPGSGTRTRSSAGSAGQLPRTGIGVAHMALGGGLSLLTGFALIALSPRRRGVQTIR